MTVGKPLRVLLCASAVVALGWVVPARRMEAQDPVPATKKRDDPPPATPVVKAIEKAAEPAEIDIPDDPPPHEGAMFSLPYRIAAPDIIVVEVLEALPGRPISGDRLVRPDGTISLGFYGSIQVTGLTPAQVKERMIILLRSHLTDEALGLIATTEDAAGPKPVAAPGDLPLPPGVPRVPAAPPDDNDDLFRAKKPAIPRPPGEDDLPRVPDDENPFEPARPKPAPKPKKTAIVGSPEGRRTRLARLARQDVPKDAEAPPDPQNRVARPATGVPVPHLVKDSDEWEASKKQIPLAPLERGSIYVHPRDSDRVSVDVASYNSKVYFVLGDVNKPGRLPWTGGETVLDALQYAGGLDPSADAKNVRLVRPSRGKMPAKVYPIDLAAIQDRGDATANLQLFPGDRLVIGRSAVVQSTIKLNADAARNTHLLNNALTYAFVLRTFDRLGELGTSKDPSELSFKFNGQTLKITLGDEAPRVDPVRRKEALKAWREYLSKTSRASGDEEQRMHDEMMKALDK